MEPLIIHPWYKVTIPEDFGIEILLTLKVPFRLLYTFTDGEIRGKVYNARLSPEDVTFIKLSIPDIRIAVVRTGLSVDFL